MHVPIHFVYLLALIPLCIIWIILFSLGRFVRRKMLVVSVIFACINVISNYFWWTRDWWLPPHIFLGRVGIEDFILGFVSGGIVAGAYEVLFRKRYVKSLRSFGGPNFLLVFCIPTIITGCLIFFFNVTTFWASSIGMILMACAILYFRRDLIGKALWSGVLMMIASVSFYVAAIALSSEWISQTYRFNDLSGITIFHIPIEEFIFWFLVGLAWGAAYEYWHREALSASGSRPMIIAEVKTQSPFGWKSDKSWNELFAIAEKVGDMISIHTDPRWGGSFELIQKARKMTKKPILAKGIHGTDADVQKAIDAGADFVLVVGRIPKIHLEKCLIEPMTLLELKTIPKNLKAVWNSRDLKTGGLKNETFEQPRKIFSGWLCQASNIKSVPDIKDGADAVLVGSHLSEFADSLK